MDSYFDVHASDYDEVFSNTAIGVLHRTRVHSYLKLILPVHQPVTILEINCGTGIDAFWLTKQGHQVIATDGSYKMIEICNFKKAKSQIYSDKKSTGPEFIHCNFVELKNQFNDRSFDVIFSDFGGLNCVGPEELKMLSENFSRLLKPGGRIIVVVMGRKCLWEWFYFFLKGNKAGRQRRWEISPTVANLHGAGQPVWYYSPAEFYSAFENEFRPELKKPVGLFIPPSYLNPFFRNKPILLKTLHWLENQFAIPAFADYADHYMSVMKKK